MRFRKYFQTVGVCIIFFLFSSIIISSAALAKETLSIGLQDDTVSLDPAKAQESVGLAVIDQMYQQLVSLAEDDLTNAIPDLAESWKVSGDGKTWTFHIRQDAVFSTGNPVTAEAVVSSLQRALQLEGDPVWMLTQIGLTSEGISQVDDYTIQIVLTEQVAPSLVLACLTTPIASILDPKEVMEHERDGDMGSAWLDMHSAGSGRFALQERQPGETLVLAANERYTGPSPAAKTVIVKNIPEPFEQTILLDKGEIDVAWNLQPGNVRQLELNPDVEIYETTTFDIRFIGMNLTYEPLSQSSVRDAIRYAIDYDSIVNFIAEGAGEPIQTIIPKGLLGHNPAMPYNFDPEKARQLLADAGYPDGFDVELVHENASPWLEIAASVKRDLGRIGVNVTLKEFSFPELLDNMFSRTFQMYLIHWESDYPDPNATVTPFAHCDSAETDASVQVMAWLSSDVNIERSKLVEQAAKDTELDIREQRYKEITEMVLYDGPYVVLFTPLKQYGTRYEVRDFLSLPSPRMTGLPPLK